MLERVLCSLGFLLAFSVLHVASAQDFPDDYFYSGAERPAGLRALEGRQAPELSLDAWIGEETSLSELSGNVIVVDFWATWCGPCMAAIPKNVSLVEKYGDKGMTFIGVHDSRNGWDKASSVVSDKGINYSVARDASGASVKSYNLSFWPTYVVIDRKGVVRAAGLVPGRVEEVVKTLLEEDGGLIQATGQAGGEFPMDWYVGGTKRLPGMAGLEGRKAPALQGGAWMGDALMPQDMKGRVTVVRFISPLSKGTRDMLPRWRKTTGQLQEQGVVFLGICDHLADWDRMKALFGDDGAPFPVTCDRAPDPGDEDALPLGVTATAYGVRNWPATVVIDRNGRVRAAGVREDRLQLVLDKLMAEPITTDS